MVMPNEEQAGRMIREAIEEVVQPNHRHRYSFDRDLMMQMLDEALGASSEFETKLLEIEVAAA